MKRIVVYGSIIIFIIILAGIQSYFDHRSKLTEVTPIEVLVYFSKSEPTDIVQLPITRFFSKSSSASEPSTVELATFAIHEMLVGPNAEEIAQGLITAINVGTQLNYLKINEGLATVDFNDQFDWQMGGSAKVIAISQQLQLTLTQFPMVDDIMITINHGERLANLEP
ncbi:MAG: GerMN domain-containing protein [Patescibacteria group bacterium]